MNNYFKVSSIPPKNNSFIYSFFKNLKVTGWLIFLNILFFILFSLLGVLKDSDCGLSFCKFIALQPNNLFLNNYWWTLLTSMFMHVNIIHLFVNLFSLYFIGNFLETLIGKKRFFWVYLLSGLFAGLFFALFAFLFKGPWWSIRIFGGADTFAMGASGALFGLVGVLALLVPRNKVFLIAGPIIALILINVLRVLPFFQSFIFLLDFLFILYVVLSIYSMVSFNTTLSKLALPIEMPLWAVPIVAIVPLIVLSLFIDLSVGNMAHLGGFIAGSIYGIYLKFKYKKKTKLIAQYYSR